MDKDFEYLLSILRDTTASMTPEKMEYLKNNTMLSPIDMLRLKKYRKVYSDLATLNEFLERFEYEQRFIAYARSWKKSWKEFGDDKSLAAYVESAINQAVGQTNGKVK